MTRVQRRKISTVIRYTLLIAVGFIMVYPLIWMVGATQDQLRDLYQRLVLAKEPGI